MLSRMMRAMTVAILSASLYGAAAHSCEDGSGVRCIEVQPDAGDWSSEGHGKRATGTAMCTPEGQKVYCLVDHSYHSCPSGQEPCCADGSNPFHSHHGHGSTDDDVVCTAAESTSTSLPSASETTTTTESLEDLKSPSDSPDDSPGRGARSPQDQYPDRGPLPKGQSPDRGVLLLDIAANQQGAEMEVRLQLQKISQHRRAIEVAIEAHLKYDRVHVDQIRIASGRRLEGRQLESYGRRLQSRELGAGHDHDHDHDHHHHVKSFEVDFLAFDFDHDHHHHHHHALSSEALRSVLNGELNKAGAGLQVAVATFSWSGAPDPEAEEEAPNLSKMAIKLMLLGSVLLLGASTVGIIACSLYRQVYCDGPSCNIAKAQFDAPTPKDVVSNDPKLVAADTEKAFADSREAEKEEDIEAGSVSTGEPADHQGSAMDNSSSEGGNNSGDCETGTGEQPAQVNSGDCESGTGEQPAQILKVSM